VPAPSVAQIRAQVAKLCGDGLDAPVIGIRAPLGVDVGERLRVGDEELSVWRGRSVLDVREHLANLPANSPPVLLLTELTEPELGQDVVIRLARRKLIPIDPWALVRHRFRARQVDPRLVQQHPWVARVLLDSEPAGDYPPAPSGFLQAETVWRLLFESLLGLRGERDAQALLDWSTDPAGPARLAALSDEVRDGLGRAVEEAAGDVALQVFRFLAGPDGAGALAVGLCARVLYDPAATGDNAAAKGQGRLEAMLDDGDLDTRVALAWADAAEAVIRRRLAEDRSGAAAPLLSAADALLAKLSATSCGHRSRVLRAGFEQRLGRFAQALDEFLEADANAPSTALSVALAAVREHDLADYDGSDRATRAEMAGRLAEWLAEQRALPSAKSASFAAAARRYRADGGHVDWARSHIRDGDPASDVSAAYARLSATVDGLREAQNRDFATAFAKWLESGSHDDAVLPVEDVLAKVVAPLARETPLLLVVVDGMGVAVFRELHQDLAWRGWLELTGDAAPSRVPVVAAVPSVTEVCRASLLCGTLTSGDRNAEKQGFEVQPDLVAAGETGRPPVVFHKGELIEEGAMGIAPAVREAIADTRRRVVSTVINAVDDHLAKGEQVRVDWTARSIRPLAALLDGARDAGRTLVLVSDHGHVIEHHSRRAGESENERWRPAAQAPGEGELRLEGPRVVLGGGEVVAPWSERLRYSMQPKYGYHGGASPQEVVIPLAVYAPPGLSVNGWREAPPEVPGWWEREADSAAAPAARTPASAKPTTPPKPGGQRSLFEADTDTPATKADTDAAWVDALLASDVMKAQRQSAARTALNEERIRAVLAALDARGGKLTRAALGKQLGLPAIRVNGVVSALRRLLNVDGYAVLSVDEESDTVTLNREILFAQFELQ